MATDGGTLSLKKPDVAQICQADAFLLCVLLELRITSGFGGTEFSGGWLTGPLLSMADFATVLFIVALILTFVVPRVAAITGVISSLLCLPLYLFFTAPSPFARIFAAGHEFKVQPNTGLHWHAWPVTGVVVVAGTVYICIRQVAGTARRQIQQPA